jgi:hypothetical protein
MIAQGKPQMVSVEAGNDLGVDPYPPKVRLIRRLDRYGGFLDALAHAQLSERCPCVGQGAMQDLLDFTDALSVQALLSFHRTKIHERVTEESFLLRRHRPSIECPGIPPLS